MLATLGGFLALLLGLLLLLLPLLVQELSRPRDSAWGAVVLLLGLVLVTSSERLTGAPMLAVLCGGLLIGRLGSEVAQARWRALSEEERRMLASSERWSRSLHQLGAVAASLLQTAAALAAAIGPWLAERRQGRARGKRWVRSEEAPGGGQVAPSADPEAAAIGTDGPSATPTSATGDSNAGAASGTTPDTHTDTETERERETGTGTDQQGGPAAAGEASIGASPDGESPAVSLESASSTAAPEPPGEGATGDSASPGDGSPGAGDSPREDDGLRVVPDFTAIDALLAAAPAGDSAAAGSATDGGAPPAPPPRDEDPAQPPPAARGDGSPGEPAADPTDAERQETPG